MRPKWIWSVALVPVVGVAAAEPAKTAPELTDAKAILERSVEATQKLKTVSYELDYQVSGWFTNFMPNIRGTVVMGKETKHEVKRFQCTLKVEPSGSGEPFELTAGADGTRFYIVDHQTKTVHADIDPGVFGKNRYTVEFSLPREFGMAKPFEDTLQGGEMRLEEAKEIDGEACYGLWLKPKTEPGATWYFSKRDFLPRRISFSAEDKDGHKATAEITIRKLVVNPTFAKDPFEVAVPEGYRRTEEFAP
jgi:hypothetical protein